MRALSLAPISERSTKDASPTVPNNDDDNDDDHGDDHDDDDVYIYIYMWYPPGILMFLARIDILAVKMHAKHTFQALKMHSFLDLNSSMGT